MFAWLQSLGLGPIDIVILAGSPICGVIGSIVRAAMIRQSLEALPIVPASGEIFGAWFFYARFTWYLAWVFVGFASGLLTALLFCGALSDSIGSAARVLGLSLIAGFGAPSLWKRQEEALGQIVAARVVAMGRKPKVGEESGP